MFPDRKPGAPYTRDWSWLWFVWLSWALLLVLWLCAGDGYTLRYPHEAVIAVTVWCAGCGALVINMVNKRGKDNMQLLRKKKPLTGESDAPEATRPTEAVRGEPVNTAKPEEGVKSPELLKDVVLTAVRKDVFIAHGARLSGLIEAESNVVTEGCIEGNILSTHQVRVDSGGVVKGDIRAVHIIVNGLVTGRCYAQAVTLQEQGRIEGDVFTDEFAIERGGVFIGQSCLPPAENPEPVKGGRDTARAAARSEEHRGAPSRKAPQPLSNQPEGGTASPEVSE